MDQYYIYYYYYRYSALGPVWAETRAQSGDWYGSGTLHPGQVLRGSLPLLYIYIYLSCFIAREELYVKCLSVFLNVNLIIFSFIKIGHYLNITIRNCNLLSAVQLLAKQITTLLLIMTLRDVFSRIYFHDL